MTFDELRKVIAEIANIPLEKIQEQSSFKNDLGIDSLQMVNLIIEISTKYNINLKKFQNNSDLQTVGNLFNVLTKEEDS